MDDEFQTPDRPWLSLLSPEWKAWRDDQFLKGRDPDAHIEKELTEAGKWPPQKPSLV